MRISRIRRILIIVFVLSLIIVAIPVVPVSGATSITLSVYSGPVGTNVIITGSGFTASTTYTVTFVSTTVISSGAVTAGSFTNTFIVPDYVRGAKTISVTTDTAETGSSSFTITSSVVLSRATGNVGDTVTVTGHGFGASLSTSIYFDSTVITTATNSASGFFTASITIPTAVQGTHTIKGTDSGGTSPTINYVITPELALSPLTQTVGSQITINGTGYKASSTITFYIDGAVISGTTAASGTTGSFTLSNYVVPVLSGGNHTITAVDTGGNSSYVTLTVNPSISLNPAKGSAGSTIAIGGSGFGTSKTITVTYGGSSVVTNPTSISSDTKGSFSAYFVVPSGNASSYTVLASDSTLSASTSFTLSGGATLNPTSGIVGTNVVVSGVNFSVGTTVIIRYDSVQMGSSRADNLGAFSFSFKIPNSSGGNHTISCTDGINTVNITFIVTASANLSPNSGVVDSEISITGKGFVASGTVTISYDSKSIATANTDAGGTFTANLKIPASATGNHTIVASDTTNNATMTFNVTAAGSLSISNGNVSDEITVKGSGFSSGKQCTVQWDNTQIAAATTDVNGSFSLTFKIPAAPRGSHVVTISEGSNTIMQQMNVASAVKITPDSGNVGSTVTLSGTGFAAGKEITVKYDSVEVAKSTTDATGSFTAGFHAPVSPGGNHQVSLTDQQETVITDFAMDSTAPAQPTPVLPANNTKAEALAVFSWSEVSDPSGVSYSLEIATDASFGNIVISKTGLSSPGYTLSKIESLKSVNKNKPYYWRVKAIDAASNESAWTTPQSFYVGIVLPAIVIYTVFGIALVLVFLIGFALGRRSSG